MNATKETDLLSEIAARERLVWDALVSGDQTADTALLCDTFLGVYSDGFAQKYDHSDQLANGPTVKSYQLSSYHIRRLGSQHAMLSYKADFQRVDREKPETMFVTSVWERQPNEWINVFSQDTPAASDTSSAT